MPRRDEKARKPKAAQPKADTAEIIHRLDIEAIKLRGETISSREGEVRGWLKKFLTDRKIVAAKKLAKLRFNAARLAPEPVGGVMHLPADGPLHEWSAEKAIERLERERKLPK